MMRTNEILHKIITKQNDICPICHEQISNFIRLEDEVLIKSKEEEAMIKIVDILQFVLGDSICSSVSAFECLCKKCANIAIKCYTFLNMAKENCELINKYIDRLSENLDASDCYRGTKSLFLTYDSQSDTFQKYYDQYDVHTKSVALKRLNTLTQDDIKVDVKIEPDYVDFEYRDTHKRKRKHYMDSIQLTTREMLFNKYDLNTIKCKECLKIYPSLSNLRNHFIRVHAPKKYKCTVCNKKFGSLALVEAHEEVSHCTLVCQKCGKTFHSRHSLRAHEIAHYVRIVCTECGRVYRSQTTYRKHIQLNICGQKTRASPMNGKFTCDYCNKRYTQKVSLRVHIQYEHGNYKSHECKWCKKKFFAQSRLKAHIVKHTQEKKFTCATCGGKFVSKESLLYHTRTHTGEKPFKCEFCDKKFISASRRTDHRKRLHPTKSLECKPCNITFSTLTCLQEHMKTHENQNEMVDPCNNVNI